MNAEIMNQALGFVKDLVSIGEALGFFAPYEEVTNQLLHRLSETNETVNTLREEIRDEIDSVRQTFLDTTTAAVVVQVRSGFLHVNNIPERKIELLIKLLFLLKTCTPHVCFAIISRYQRNQTKTGTLGFAAHSSDEMQDIIHSVNSFISKITDQKKPKTTYIN